MVRASIMDQMVKNLPAMQETWVQFLGQEDPLEKGKATYSSILAQIVIAIIYYYYCYYYIFIAIQSQFTHPPVSQEHLFCYPFISPMCFEFRFLPVWWMKNATLNIKVF